MSLPADAYYHNIRDWSDPAGAVGREHALRASLNALESMGMVAGPVFRMVFPYAIPKSPRHDGADRVPADKLRATARIMAAMSRDPVSRPRTRSVWRSGLRVLHDELFRYLPEEPPTTTERAS